MSIDELREHFSDKDIFDKVYLNPIHVLEGIEFNKKEDRFNKCQDTYSVRAIKSAIKKNLPFCSTWNNMCDIPKMFIKITCPYCKDGTEMDNNGGGGNGNGMTINFKCPKCSSSCSISGGAETFSFKPKTS